MEFYLNIVGAQEGPFTVEELSQRGITPETEVWAPGMASWAQAGDVPELTAVLQRAEFEAAQAASRAAANQPVTGSPYVPPYDPMPPEQPAGPACPNPPQRLADSPKKRGCTPWLIGVLILVILFATMVFTCPDRQDHEQAIQEVTNEWMGDKIQEGLSGFTGTEGFGGVVGDIISKIVREFTGQGSEFAITNYLDVKNYLVCSVGSVSVGDMQEKTVSFGIFGHVFTFNKEDLEAIWAKVLDDYEANNGFFSKKAPQPGSAPDDEAGDADAATPDPSLLPDSVMGVGVPDEVDTLFNQMANEAIRVAKEWAKQQIDQLGQ